MHYQYSPWISPWISLILLKISRLSMKPSSPIRSAGAGTSIGANIREAQYAHGTADFVAKLQIALKEANETGYWLELLFKTDYISEEQYKELDAGCTSLRVMLISSINTIKSKQ